MNVKKVKKQTGIYRMLSIDSSSCISGYAYFENGVLKESGTLNQSKEKDSEIRLENMCLALNGILSKYEPETVVIEMTVVERNAKTQRMLSEIVGVVRGWALIHFAEFVEYRPTVWRKLITGEKPIPKKREDCKAWSITTVQAMYPKHIVKDDNESDAILIGIARINEMARLSRSA